MPTSEKDFNYRMLVRWMRGEWANYHDRVAPGTLIDLTGDGTSSSHFAQNDPKPFTSTGWYAAVGYKMENSIWNNSDCGCGEMPSWLKPFEFVARYDTFQNIQVASTAKENDAQLYKTTVLTGGVNYYIRGHFAKIQVNYNAVRYPSAGTGVGYAFHQTNSNSLMCNFQVAF